MKLKKKSFRDQVKKEIGTENSEGNIISKPALSTWATKSMGTK